MKPHNHDYLKRRPMLLNPPISFADAFALVNATVVAQRSSVSIANRNNRPIATNKKSSAVLCVGLTMVSESSCRVSASSRC